MVNLIIKIYDWIYKRFTGRYGHQYKWREINKYKINLIRKIFIYHEYIRNWFASEQVTADAYSLKLLNHNMIELGRLVVDLYRVQHGDKFIQETIEYLIKSIKHWKNIYDQVEIGETPPKRKMDDDLIAYFEFANDFSYYEGCAIILLGSS